MIPKKIHYCWFGEGKLPELAIKCIDSWKKLHPDWEVIEWNEKNTDLTKVTFVKQAYENKKYAFVSDYIRLKVIYDHGGVYLDTDVELLKPLDIFLKDDAFMGFEFDTDQLNSGSMVNTGLGFGAIPKHPIIKELLSSYENIEFTLPDGTCDTTPCPVRDTKILTNIGLSQNNTNQRISLNNYDLQVYSSDYFSPLSYKGEKNFTERTHSIHHYAGSWLNKKDKKAIKNLRVKKTLISKYSFVGSIAYRLYRIFN